jgi:thiamine-phosphate pyrophosphorylase
MLLYYITDRKGFPVPATQQIDALLRRIGEAARAGVDYIQLREKDLPTRELEALASKALRGVRDNSPTTKLLINSRADIALATGADGVHLPEGDLAVAEVRALWMQCSNQQPLIGVSAHTAADVRRARSDGADLAVLAPIFEKVQTGARGIGLDALREACALVRAQGATESSPQRGFAVLALGGVTVGNAGACLEAGAAGVAGIRLFQQGDVFDTVRRLREIER